jgi:hypothetical protein
MPASLTTLAAAAPYFIPLVFAAIPTSDTKPNHEVVSAARHDLPTPAYFAYGDQSLTQNLQARPELAPARCADWIDEATVELLGFASLEDGWKGEGSIAPSSAAIVEACMLVDQIANEMPDMSAPLISADDEGFICLYWRSTAMIATLTVYGDETYSYFASGYGHEARNDAASIEDILPSDIIAAMTGDGGIGPLPQA